MNIYKAIVDYLENNRKGVLATVIRRTGSSPRDVGAKMFVGEDGRTFGTVGGGRLESDAYARAVAEMGSTAATVFSIVMDGKEVTENEMLCGGNVEVLLEPVKPGHLGVYGKIRDVLKRRGRGAAITKFHPNPFGKSFLDGEMAVTGDPVDGSIIDWCKGVLAGNKLAVGDGMIADPLQGSVPLYLFGAGHVAQFVALIAGIADFHVTVIDDRAEFANRERFSDAGAILVTAFHDAFSRLPFTGDEYVVILTRSHELDAQVLAECMKRPVRYVGMIGSSRKVKIILDHLRSLGFNEGTIRKIHAPIGIPIGAETPQEIGIAIAAELVAVRSGTVSR
ncbi:MAG: putative xanthine dehydrogenase subunit A [Syntrophorhabdaceae bacterium PtaU1.Bin034]|jgi:xanthine dehydrogenase accessory factor|nr:MAG: putative xanthine dehydrogenase subunit A [Syntrophorhabdaceae bacterium PtaU1.Bin034]